MKLVILDAETFGEVSLEPLIQGFGKVDIHGTTQTEEVPERLAQADIAVSNKVLIGETAMNRAKNLKLICVAATGTNNIALHQAKRREIPVCNLPGYSTPSVVSHTFALAFHLLHHNSYHDNYTRAGAWCNSRVFTHLAQPYREMASRTWGIVGMGTIGQAVAGTARSFGCHVLYTSTSGKNTDQPYPCLPLEALLTQADIVSIHAPLNPRTEGLIGRHAISLMKKEAILINTARGGIVVEQDLADALDAGQLAGAGVDVLSMEPPPDQHPLLRVKAKDRLILTPHIAGLSSDARARLVAGVRANIDAFLAGTPTNLV